MEDGGVFKTTTHIELAGDLFTFDPAAPGHAAASTSGVGSRWSGVFSGNGALR